MQNGKVENQADFVTLTGAGLGVRIYGPCHFDLSCDVAFPLTKEKETARAFAYLRVTWMPF